MTKLQKVKEQTKIEIGSRLSHTDLHEDMDFLNEVIDNLYDKIGYHYSFYRLDTHDDMGSILQDGKLVDTIYRLIGVNAEKADLTKEEDPSEIYSSLLDEDYETNNVILHALLEDRREMLKKGAIKALTVKNPTKEDYQNLSKYHSILKDEHTIIEMINKNDNYAWANEVFILGPQSNDTGLVKNQISMVEERLKEIEPKIDYSYKLMNNDHTV